MQRYGHYRSSLHKNRIVAGLKHRFAALTGGSFLKNAILALIALGLIGGLVVFLGYLYIAQTLPSVDDILNRDVAQSTKIYDRTGEHLLYEIAKNEKRTIVPFDRIPQNVVNATLAAEDRHFYKHGALSYLGILRSIYVDIKCGCKAQGASTLTQQMVRNVILTLDKDWTRKIREILLSYAVESQFTKNQILELYFNQIGYGSTNYGVQAASQSYFGKDVSELTLAESATLAAMPKQPSRYLRDPELLKGRRDWILGEMEELGYATHDEVVAALAQDTPIVAHLNDITAPHFVLWVKEQLETEYTEREVETGGLHVITTLDYDKQSAAEAAVRATVEAKGDIYGFNNASLLSIDPKTGQILAMVGSADYNNDEIHGQVNVTQQPLQPGSSMKPIVYAAAWEKGYTPNTILWDVNTPFSTETGEYNPRNYDNGEHGYVTMRKALQGSLNIPAVKALYLVGIDNALDFTDRMGYTTLSDRSRFGLSLVLGGGEVTMIDHLRAYGTFANNGIQHDTVGILRVEDSKGNILEEWRPEDNSGKEVVSTNLSAIVSHVLSDNDARAYIFGTNSALQVSGRPVAAKTGTTNDFNDAWTVGYTPSLATAVWVGNTDGTVMKKNAEAIFVAAPMWKEYMQNALANTPVEQFPTPTIDTTGKPMLDGAIPVRTYTIDTSSGKLATNYTPERYRKDETCGEYHTILATVNKDDPRGAIPSDPASDPYYQPWEDAVQVWIANHNATLKEHEEVFIPCGAIPTEYDDVHTERNQPNLRITDPNNHSAVSRTFTVRFASEVHGTFDRIEYAIDGSYTGFGTSMDEDTITLPSWVSAGKHTLTATIFDANKNSANDSIEITVTEASSQRATFTMTNPFDGQTIENVGASYAIVVEVPDPSEMTYLEITAYNLWTGETDVIGSTTSPNAITSISWNLPSNGKYQLTARAASPSGETLEADPVVVTVTTPAASSIPINP